MVRSMVSWALIGSLAAVLGTIMLAVAAAAVFDISQMEGAYAMGVAFFWVPLGLVAGLVAGGIVGWRRRP